MVPAVREQRATLGPRPASPACFQAFRPLGGRRPVSRVQNRFGSLRGSRRLVDKPNNRWGPGQPCPVPRPACPEPRLADSQRPACSQGSLCPAGNCHCSAEQAGCSAALTAYRATCRRRSSVPCPTYSGDCRLPPQKMANRSCSTGLKVPGNRSASRQRRSPSSTAFFDFSQSNRPCP